MIISIIGLPGSGKTTHAKQLAHESHLRHVDLDWLIYEKPYGAGRKPLEQDEYMALIEQEMSQGGVIFEGIYAFPRLLERADHIIWLDPPIWILLYRIWKRQLTDRFYFSRYTWHSTWKLTRDTIKMYFGHTGRITQSGIKLYTRYELRKRLAVFSDKKIVKIIRSSK